jgi:hypothetical protein
LSLGVLFYSTVVVRVQNSDSLITGLELFRLMLVLVGICGLHIALARIALLAYHALASLVQIAMDNKDAILGSMPAEDREEGAKLYTALLEEKVGFI